MGEDLTVSRCSRRRRQVNEWDATCVHPLSTARLLLSSRTARAAAADAEKRKMSNYRDLGLDYVFVPIAFDTYGGVGHAASAFISYLQARLRGAGTSDRHVSLFRQFSYDASTGKRRFAAGVLGVK